MLKLNGAFPSVIDTASPALFWSTSGVVVRGGATTSFVYLFYRSIFTVIALIPFILTRKKINNLKKDFFLLLLCSLSFTPFIGGFVVAKK